VFLARHGPSTPTQGGRRLQLATASVTALIDRLEHLGLVARRRHRTDRRKVVVDLSETGHNAAELVQGQLGAALQRCSLFVVEEPGSSAAADPREPSRSPERHHPPRPTLHLGQGHHPVVITEVASPAGGLV
jgi:hypothetical protein